MITRRALLSPPHPGLVLRQYLYDIPDTVEQLGLTEVQLEAVYDGRAPVTADMDARLTALLRTPPGLWVALQEDHETPRRRLDPEQAELEAQIDAPLADVIERLVALPPSLRRTALELYALRYGLKLYNDPEQQRLLSETVQALDGAVDKLKRRSDYSMLDLAAERLIGMLLDAERWRRGRQWEKDRVERVLRPQKQNAQRRTEALERTLTAYREWDARTPNPQSLGSALRVEQYIRDTSNLSWRDKRRLREWIAGQSATNFPKK